jgi:hypothetical protein
LAGEGDRGHTRSLRDPFCCLGVPESFTVRTANVRLKTYLRAVVLTVVWLLLDSSGQALACSCAGPADSLCRLMPINLAFVGTPTAVADVLRDGWPARKFTFRIQESFSSVEGPFVDVFSDKSTCGVDFVVGKSYLVDALKDGRGTITVSLCSLTRSAARAVEEIANPAQDRRPTTAAGNPRSARRVPAAAALLRPRGVAATPGCGNGNPRRTHDPPNEHG